MAFFRVPFSGSVLIETDVAAWATIVAAHWTGAMKQAKHGVEIGALPPPGVMAVEFSIDTEGVEDVTQQFQGSVTQNMDAARKNPGAEVIAQKFCAT